MHAERLTVPLRWWVQGTMLVASLWLALVVAVPEPLAWTVTGLALLGVAAFFLSYGRAVVRVHPAGPGSEGPVLQAGRARIEVRHLGAATALDAAASRRAAGVEADARAYLLLRPYLKRSVKVEVRDPADPTPYWLVATRHPHRLVDALEAVRPGSRSTPAEGPEGPEGRAGRRVGDAR